MESYAPHFSRRLPDFSGGLLDLLVVQKNLAQETGHILLDELLRAAERQCDLILFPAFSAGSATPGIFLRRYRR